MNIDGSASEEKQTGKRNVDQSLSNSDLYRYWSNTWDYLPSDVDTLVKRYNRRECFVSVLCLYTWCELKMKRAISLSPSFVSRSPYFVCRCIWQRSKLEDRFSLRIASNLDWRFRSNNSDCLHTSIHRRRLDNEQDSRNVHLVDTFASAGRLCVWRYQWGELVRLGMTIDDGLLRWHRGTYHRFYRKLTIKRTMVTSQRSDLFSIERSTIVLHIARREEVLNQQLVSWWHEDQSRKFPQMISLSLSSNSRSIVQEDLPNTEQ